MHIAVFKRFHLVSSFQKVLYSVSSTSHAVAAYGPDESSLDFSHTWQASD